MRFCITGCTVGDEPIEAHQGYLCNVCFGNLRNALSKAPAVLQHLREVYVLRPPVELDGAKPLKKDPPAPFNLDAWQLAEEIWQALADQYIPLDWDHQRVYQEALGKCQQLGAKLDELANRKEIIYMMPVIKLVRTANYRYPLEEKPRSTLLPCPQCNQRTVYQPPVNYGETLEVSCQSCGFSIPPEKMEFYANLAERERDANL